MAGALAASRLGRRVVLTEETDWIGGLDKDLVPNQVRDRAENLEDFQRLLADVLGFELSATATLRGPLSNMESA